MRRWLFLLYGLGAYASFLVASAYAFLVIGGYLPGSPFRAASADAAWWPWLANLGLVVLFGVQHSVMARPWFKHWWTRFVPQVVERSTYVIISSVAMVLLVALWQPVGVTLWNVDSMALRMVLLALSAAGWLIVVGTSFLINHFDLFGLRQVWLHFRGLPYTSLPFDTPGMYRWVRHPLYIGWLLAFWSTPTMTTTHLLFAGGITVYILLAIRWEEADLIAHFGEQYAAYRRRVPMLIPWPAAKESNDGCVPTPELSKTTGRA